eukprot:Skav223721  [mRNA]  locus=scaffold2564:183011:186912:- [translate_table: standard]
MFDLSGCTAMLPGQFCYVGCVSPYVAGRGPAALVGDSTFASATSGVPCAVPRAPMRDLRWTGYRGRRVLGLGGALLLPGAADAELPGTELSTLTPETLRTAQGKAPRGGPWERWCLPWCPALGVAIITGGTSGVGLEAARVLAANGCVTWCEHMVREGRLDPDVVRRLHDIGLNLVFGLAFK